MSFLSAGKIDFGNRIVDNVSPMWNKADIRFRGPSPLVWQRFNNRTNIGFYVILRMSDYNRLKLNVSRLPAEGGGRGDAGRVTR